MWLLGDKDRRCESIRAGRADAIDWDRRNKEFNVAASTVLAG